MASPLLSLDQPGSPRYHCMFMDFGGSNMLKLFVGLSILIPTAAFAQTFVENTIPFPDYPDPTPWCRQTAAVGDEGSPTRCVRAVWERVAVTFSEALAEEARLIHHHQFADGVWLIRR